MITLGGTKIRNVRHGAIPIANVYIGDKLIFCFVELYDKFLLTHEQPSIYMNYCFEETGVWDDTAIWTERTPVIYNIFEKQSQPEYRKGFDSRGLLKTSKLMKTDVLYK